MRIDKVYIKTQFKNLNDFKIDINENSMETVLIGLNATGKSNFLEALVVIFRDLDLERPPQPFFEYNIIYECRGKIIEIDYSKTNGYQYLIDGMKPKYKSDFNKNKEQYLPKHVFIYYSGISERLKDLYFPHQAKYYNEIIKKGARYEKFNTIRRIFLVQPIHASFALIAFFMFKKQEEETIKFLREELRIHDFGSALFVLKKPSWVRSQNAEDRFWGADGLVRRFLEDLWLFSLAPIYNDDRVHTTYKKAEVQKRLYLFLSNKEVLQELVDLKYPDKIHLFNALESLHISDLIHDFKIRVVKEHVDGELSMHELSEGEKQLLTVLGLLKFTKDDESLVLLDEPDTHLNPLWKWNYLEYLSKVVQRPESTQIIFCTHDPLVIGGMDKSQVRVFKKDLEDGITSVADPDISPKGLGVAGILTSELFGLPTTLDSDTQNKIDRKNQLITQQKTSKISEKEQEELRLLFDELNQLGFTKTFRDPLYQKFIAALSQREEFKTKTFTKDELEKQNTLALDLLDEIIKEEQK